MALQKLIAIAISVALFSSSAQSAAPSVEEIFKKVDQAYENLTTYQSEGTIKSDIDMGVRKLSQVTTFSILLKKPNMYRISWRQTGGPMIQSGNVWSDGTQPYLHMSAVNAYSKMENDQIALGGATGISGGAAFTVPALVLSAFASKTSLLSRLKKARVEEVETVEGEECFVISGSSVVSKRETYWISKKSYLIRKYSRSLEAPEGGAAIPEISDKDLEEAIKGLGQEVTEEAKKKLKETMERSKKMIKTMKLKGISTEVHTAISMPELKASDFQFSPPNGTTEKESLFGGFLGGN